MNISALVLARNEEEMIKDCLSQLNFVDEIIILDQGSTDKTRQIAKKYTKKIFTTSYESFAKNREILAAHAKSDWLLYIDVDERFDNEVIEEIKEAIRQQKYQAFYFPRKNIILGKWLRHGGWFPDYVPKLFERGSLKGWTGQVHESPKVDGAFGYFKTPITHLTARNLSSMLGKTIKWAKVEADLAYSANHPRVTITRVIWAAAKEFSGRYFVKLGLLDGFIGFIEAVYQALHRAITLVYLWETQNNIQELFEKTKDKLNE
ncbi:MAG: glycosyltransferase family 2 protein [Candidatus Curtissbacteria bacterium]|nr:glycosyltransferase family 2 protein [Candidatus Curtissbacteria bacterium]